MKHHTSEQIIAALRQVESGIPAVEVCRRMGITEQTFYRWKRKFAGLGIAELARLKQLVAPIRLGCLASCRTWNLR